jgi:FMN reductase
MKLACQLVAGAAGIVLVTPVYKAAYSGLLKSFLDVLPQFALEDKVALPLAVGGTLSHMLIIDYALRPVLASMGSPNTLAGVFFLDSWLPRTDSGDVAINDEVATRLRASLNGFSQALHEKRLRATDIRHAQPSPISASG